MIDKNDIEQLFRTHYLRMYRVAVLLLHDEDLARDIVHDVFASLLCSDHSILPSESYLLTAVRNRSLNHIRNCDIHRRVENRYFIENEDYESENWPDEETIAKIYSFIENKLSPQESEIIKFRFIPEGKTPKFSEIAKMMGISETAVYRHLKHALTIIRKNIKQNG